MGHLPLSSVYLLGLLLSPGLLRGGDPRSPVLEQTREHDLKPTGNARVDFVGLPAPEKAFLSVQDAIEGAAGDRRKSPWIAAGLSALVPGSGEFYAESYWKSAAFFAVEVAVWTAAYIYDKKADRQTDLFQDYANAHWSVVRYAQYADDHLAPAATTYNWLIPGTEGRNPWERVNWTELQRMERDIGGYFSHTLPYYGEQQYYELIGKYPQFNQGWDDSPPTFNYGDPLTVRFQYYADERGKANSYYNTATTMVTVAIINHLISSIDAAFTAGSYNRGLHAGMGIRTVPTASGPRAVSVLNLRYDF